MLLPLTLPGAHLTKITDPTSSSLYSYSLSDMTYESEGLFRSGQLHVPHVSFGSLFDVRSRVVWGVKNSRGEGLTCGRIRCGWRPIGCCDGLRDGWRCVFR